MGNWGMRIDNKNSEFDIARRTYSKPAMARKQINPKSLYRDLKILGSGSSTRVYLVENKYTKDKRALKEIKKDQFGQVDADKLYESIKKLSGLVKPTQDHPNIVKIYEIIEANTYFYITSEYLEGGELFEKFLKVKKFEEKVVCEYFFDILSAIKYSHSKGIIHKDLKPENLMLSSNHGDALIKLIDFGTSYVIYIKEGAYNSAMDSIYYTAPEQLNGEALDKSDIWALGIILFMMLSGKPPYFSRNVADTSYKILNEGVFFLGNVWNNISNEVQELLELMLIKDPEKRPSAEIALQHPWFKLYHKPKKLSEVSLKYFKTLISFKCECNITKFVLRYICNQRKEIRDNLDVIHLFKVLDLQTNAKLSRNDILSGLQQFELNGNIDDIMSNIDFNNNGLIDFSEFLVATQDWSELLSQKAVIKSLKSDGKNKNITLTELRNTIPMFSYEEIKNYILRHDLKRLDSISYKDLREILIKNLQPMEETY